MLRVTQHSPNQWRVEQLVLVGVFYEEHRYIGEIREYPTGWFTYRCTGAVGSYVLEGDGVDAPWTTFDDAVRSFLGG